MKALPVSCAVLLACAHPGSTNPQPGVAAKQEAAARAKFVNAVKAAIAKIWVPQVEAAACENDPDGTRWSTVDRRTVISYVVDGTGTIVETQLVTSSGADYLDAVALQAPKGLRVGKPPEPLLGENGTATLSFAFTLQHAPPVSGKKHDACHPR